MKIKENMNLMSFVDNLLNFSDEQIKFFKENINTNPKIIKNKNIKNSKDYINEENIILKELEVDFETGSENFDITDKNFLNKNNFINDNKIKWIDKLINYYSNLNSV